MLSCPRKADRRPDGINKAKRLNKGASMDNYIIRIYRQEKNNPEKLVGVLEKVGEESKRSSQRLAARRQAFTNIDELWEILSATGNLPKRKKQDRGTR